jgi:hypothetical protein
MFKKLYIVSSAIHPKLTVTAISVDSGGPSKMQD